MLRNSLERKKVSDSTVTSTYHVLYIVITNYYRQPKRDRDVKGENNNIINFTSDRTRRKE